MNIFFRIAICSISMGTLAIAKAQDINHFEGITNSIPSPNFTTRTAISSAPVISIERIAGCMATVWPSTPAGGPQARTRNHQSYL